MVERPGGQVELLNASLKVMLESTYAKERGQDAPSMCPDGSDKAAMAHAEECYRTMILPVMTAEVNGGVAFAEMRVHEDPCSCCLHKDPCSCCLHKDHQELFRARVLAAHFKKKFAAQPEVLARAAALGRLKLASWEVDGSSWGVRDLFERYKTSASKGEYNLEDEVLKNGQSVVYSYFYGGVDWRAIELPEVQRLKTEDTSLSKKHCEALAPHVCSTVESGPAETLTGSPRAAPPPQQGRPQDRDELGALRVRQRQLAAQDDTTAGGAGGRPRRRLRSAARQFEVLAWQALAGQTPLQSA